MPAVLFDMDGVLVDSFDVWFQVLNEAADELDYPAISAAQLRASWGQGVEADVDHYYRGRSLAEVEACFERHLPAAIDRLIRNPGAVEAFTALREAGYSVAVITNTPHALACTMLEQVGLAPDVIVGGTDVGEAKPAPDMVFLACERLEVATGDAWVVGDSEYDRRAAKGAGVRFIGYGGIEAEWELSDLHHVVHLVREAATA